MASICMSQANYQQQHHHHLQQQFQLLNGSNAGILLQQQQMTAYSKRQVTAPPPTTKAPLGTSHLQNIQPRVIGNGATRLVGMLPKKKYNYANMPYGEQQLPSVQRRNARERNRVKQVNNGFTNLRQHLPQTVINTLSHGGRGASKKLSKVDTLRIAVEYIRGLQDLLDDAGATSSSSTSFSSAAATFQLNDDYSNDGSNFDDDSEMGSPAQDASMYQPMPQYHSEASASPTPSYTDSDISIGGVNYLQPITLEVTKSQQQQPQHQSTVTQQMHFKFEPFDTYEQPNDEELLDYISSWQQQ